MNNLDRTALWIASQHHEYGPLVEHQVRAAGMTPGEWLRRLDRLAYDLEAAAYDPVTCRRIRDAHARAMTAR